MSFELPVRMYTPPQVSRRLAKAGLLNCFLCYVLSSLYLNTCFLVAFRWTEVAKQLGVKFTNLIGDVLVSSGVVAYLGAFTAAFRQVRVEAMFRLQSRSLFINFRIYSAQFLQNFPKGSGR